MHLFFLGRASYGDVATSLALHENTVVFFGRDTSHANVCIMTYKSGIRGHRSEIMICMNGNGRERMERRIDQKSLETIKKEKEGEELDEKAEEKAKA
jgi:hypothetical protein